MSSQLIMEFDGPVEDLVYFDPQDLEPWPDLNPRKAFDPEKLAELEASIEEHGVLQNIVVHDRGKPSLVTLAANPQWKRYWIVVGETRWRAATNKRRRLPARVRHFTEAQALTLALLENIQRNDLTPIEEAEGFARLLALDSSLTQAKLAETFGKKDQSYVANRLRLLKLPDSVKQLVSNGTLPHTLARDQLLPWLEYDEAVQQRLFGTLIQLINGRGDDAPVSGAWLRATVDKLQSFIVTTTNGASKPATPAKKTTKPAAKKSTPVKKPVPTEVESGGAAQIAEQAASEESAAEQGTTPGSAAEGHDEPTTEEHNATDTQASEAPEPREAADAGDTAAAAAASTDADEASEGEAAQERVSADPVPGIIGAAQPALAHYTMVLQLTPVAGDSQHVFLNISAKPLKRGSTPGPHAITGTAAEVAERLEAELRRYVENLPVPSGD